MGTHPIFESDFDCLTDYFLKMGLHENTEPLTLSNELCEQAQEWADKLIDLYDNLKSEGKSSHCPRSERYGAGENIARSSIRISPTIVEEAIRASNSWYSEIDHYDYNNPDHQSGTGHFTQVVWRESKELGFGIAHRESDGKLFVVARYQPTGNYAGRYEENVTPLK